MKRKARAVAYFLNSVVLAGACLNLLSAWQNVLLSHQIISFLLVGYIISIYFRITEAPAVFIGLLVNLILLGSYWYLSFHWSPNLMAGIDLIKLIIPVQVVQILAGWAGRESPRVPSDG